MITIVGVMTPDARAPFGSPTMTRVCKGFANRVPGGRLIADIPDHFDDPGRKLLKVFVPSFEN